jgi:hypothetical protein
MTEPLHLSAGGVQRPRAAQVPYPCEHHIPGALSSTGQERVGDLQETDQDDLWKGPQQRQRTVASEQEVEPVTGLQSTPLIHPPAGGEKVAVARHGGGGDHHPSPRDLRSPAQAHVVEKVFDVLVEPTDLVEKVGSHQRAGPRHGEHVAYGVVLGLIQFTPLDERHPEAGMIHSLTDLKQALRVVPVHQFRAHHRGIRAKSFLHQEAYRTRFQRDVVVAAEIERGSLHQPEPLVDRGTEPGVVVESVHDSIGGCLSHPLRHRHGAVGVHHQQRQVRVVLGHKSRHDLVEPGPRVARHHHRNHCRNGRGRGGDRVGEFIIAGGRGLHGCSTIVRSDVRPTHPRGRGARLSPFISRQYPGVMSRPQIEEVATIVQDVAYVSVGLGVLAFQRLQVRRHEITKNLEGHSQEARGTLDLVGSLVSERLKLVEERLSAALDITRR